MTDTKEKKQREKDLDVNLIPVFRFLLKKLWIIILAGVIAAAGTFIVTKLTIPEKYQSSFTAYVNNQSQIDRESLSSSDILASQKIVLTYSKILTSDTVLESAAKELGEGYTYDRLAKKVSTQVLDETEIIKVNVVARSPEEAYDIAKAIAKVSPSCMKSIVEGSSMRIVDNPKLPLERFSPSYFKLGLIGGIIGALLTAAFFIIRFFTDDSVRSEEDLEKRFDVLVVGVIPDIHEAFDPNSNYRYSKSYSYGGYDNQKGGSDHA